MKHRWGFKVSTGKKRPNISFDTMFVWFGMKFEAVICQKPLWAESSPPRSLEGTKKPGLLRVNTYAIKEYKLVHEKVLYYLPGRNQSHFRIQRFSWAKWHGRWFGFLYKFNSIIWCHGIFLVIYMTARIWSAGGITWNGSCCCSNIIVYVIMVCYFSTWWIH